MRWKWKELILFPRLLTPCKFATSLVKTKPIKQISNFHSSSIPAPTSRDQLNFLNCLWNVYRDLKFKSWAVIFILKLLSEISSLGSFPTTMKCFDRICHEINMESINSMLMIFILISPKWQVIHRFLEKIWWDISFS